MWDSKAVQAKCQKFDECSGGRVAAIAAAQPTKAELRAMLEEAARNTAAIQNQGARE